MVEQSLLLPHGVVPFHWEKKMHCKWPESLSGFLL